jgi:hypothetical protein
LHAASVIDTTQAAAIARIGLQWAIIGHSVESTSQRFAVPLKFQRQCPELCFTRGIAVSI